MTAMPTTTPSPESPEAIPRQGYFLIALAVLAVDQLTKVMALRWLADRGPVETIPNFLNLSFSLNPGGLFGYFGSWPDPWRTVLLTILPFAAIGLIAWFLGRSDELDRRTLLGLALILGGAVGNLIDRLIRGSVVDFLDVYAASPKLAAWFVEHFGTSHWPTFNVADAAIVSGAGLLLLTVVVPPKPVALPPTGDTSATSG